MSGVQEEEVVYAETTVFVRSPRSKEQSENKRKESGGGI